MKGHTAQNGAAGARALKYAARAGLLPELSRQTYDSLAKALREAVLNAADAGASCTVLDFSDIGKRHLVIADDGRGMSPAEVEEFFLGLGGSPKYGAPAMYGRIGIGSLALLRYAESAVVETKTAEAEAVSVATIDHGWLFTAERRRLRVDELAAGTMVTRDVAEGEHGSFTRIGLRGVDDDALEQCGDVAAFFRLVERLRRILPLSWGSARLQTRLEEVAPDLVRALRNHVRQFSTRVVVRGPWSGEIELTKRWFGEGESGEETWLGDPWPLKHAIRIRDGARVRTVYIYGYLLAQEHAHAGWSGLTARVQNVAVEEGTYFGIEGDPGFRRYITGEAWIAGDVDRARLINIDRSSLNRESRDYREVARYIRDEIERFKRTRVQAPQRAKTNVRRRLAAQRAFVRSVEEVVRAAAFVSPKGGLPSSGTPTLGRVRDRSLAADLTGMGAVLEEAECPHQDPARRGGDVRMSRDGVRILVSAQPSLLAPVVQCGDRRYEVILVESYPSAPPVRITNRPRRIAFNLAHPLFGGEVSPVAAKTALALEVAFLRGQGGGPEGMYEEMLNLLATV